MLEIMCGEGFKLCGGPLAVVYLVLGGSCAGLPRFTSPGHFQVTRSITLYASASVRNLY
jgi:hypothetical protein